MWNIGLINTVNTRQAWAAPEGPLEALELLWCPAAQDLYPPIRQVGCPAAHAESFGLAAREPPEADALHSATDEPPHGPLTLAPGHAMVSRSRPLPRRRHQA
jgi:hypothetical protein